MCWFEPARSGLKSFIRRVQVLARRVRGLQPPHALPQALRGRHPFLFRFARRPTTGARPSCCSGGYDLSVRQRAQVLCPPVRSSSALKAFGRPRPPKTRSAFRPFPSPNSRSVVFGVELALCGSSPSGPARLACLSCIPFSLARGTCPSLNLPSAADS